MKNQVSWLIMNNAPDQLLKRLNPLRRLKMWNNNRKIKNFLFPHIERSMARHGTPTEGPKTITDLAANLFVAEMQTDSRKGRVDSEFIDSAIQNMKIFILAGHDTTASTISYAYHLLHINPSTLATLRAEHAAVFGPDPSTAAATITASPHLLNQLPYTSAVIKETLRLYPPIGTIRRGSSSFYLTHPETGTRYATDGFMMFGCSVATHRLDAFWPRASEFVPERWLARVGEPLHVRKNAFRPFELGPRNCIGQELAQLELRLILALTIREFDVRSVYADDAPTVLGEKAYQCLLPGQITAHPKGMMPVTVSMRK
jgi:cytochrome P450